MSNKILFGGLLLLLSSCRGSGEVATERARVAEKFFRGLYGGDRNVVDDLASADIVVSYPIFPQLFGKAAIRGWEAVKSFGVRFSKKWADQELRIEESVATADRVVLLWSFRARDVGGTQNAQSSTNREHAWGGISLFRFDEAGKIVAEIGEESEPGPFQRLLTGTRN